MSDVPVPLRHHIRILVRDDTCPLLLAAFEQVPADDENIFIRGVLSQWFAQYANTDLAARAIKEMVVKQRLAEQTNRSGNPRSTIFAPSCTDSSSDTDRSDAVVHRDSGSPP